MKSRNMKQLMHVVFMCGKMLSNYTMKTLGVFMKATMLLCKVMLSKDILQLGWNWNPKLLCNDVM
jgi:isoprenylcysteine carboxyl methyltransferase (ICMT) family protein YpbQ